MKLFISISDSHVDVHTRERMRGRCFSELTSSKYIYIYRACDARVKTFKPYDYVTMSKKFAFEHAQTSAAYHEEPQHILKLMVAAKDVYEAPNPGEFFYTGPEKTGQVFQEVPVP